MELHFPPNISNIERWCLLKIGQMNPSICLPFFPHTLYLYLFLSKQSVSDFKISSFHNLSILNKLHWILSTLDFPELNLLFNQTICTMSVVINMVRFFFFSQIREFYYWYWAVFCFGLAFNNFSGTVDENFICQILFSSFFFSCFCYRTS